MTDDLQKQGALAALETRLGHRFSDGQLLESALTHRSYANEKGLTRNYERLEFLGDSVLGLLAVEWLYASHPDRPEGELSQVKSFLVSEPVLAHFARRLEMGKSLRLGVGEERSGGREKPSLLADVFEAVIGALYLDGGLSAAREIVGDLLGEAFRRRAEFHETADAKSKLQEWVQAQGWELPEYRIVAEEGPDHQKVFSVECWVQGRSVGSGTGRSRKLAEQSAAEQALKELASD